jgi:hypothetical protein
MLRDDEILLFVVRNHTEETGSRAEWCVINSYGCMAFTC